MGIPFWSLIVTVIASGVAIILSIRSLKQSSKANKLSQNAIAQTEIHFEELNRPILVAKPITYLPANNYFRIKYLKDQKIIVSIPLELRNVGYLAAHDIQLHSTVSFLYLNNNTIGGHRISEYEQLGDKLSWIDIAPNDGIVKIIDLEFQLRPDLDISKLPKDLSSSGKVDPNFFFKYYRKIHNQKKEFHLNISFEIAYQWYGVLARKI